MRSTLIATRKQKKMTQEEVAHHLSVGRSTYTRIERGSRSPSLKVAFEIANLFGMPIENLFPEIRSEISHQSRHKRKELALSDIK